MKERRIVIFVQSTIACECGCIFESEFQTSTLEKRPICPQCRKAIGAESWKHLRSIMADLNDFNTHMVKWHSDRGEPLMQVPAMTVRTLKD